MSGLTVGEIAQQVYGAAKSGGKSAELRRRVEEIIRQAWQNEHWQSRGKYRAVPRRTRQ